MNWTGNNGVHAQRPLPRTSSWRTQGALRTFRGRTNIVPQLRVHILTLRFDLLAHEAY